MWLYGEMGVLDPTCRERVWNMSGHVTLGNYQDQEKRT